MVFHDQSQPITESVQKLDQELSYAENTGWYDFYLFEYLL
jgi:hypothetical protein